MVGAKTGRGRCTHLTAATASGESMGNAIRRTIAVVVVATTRRRTTDLLVVVGVRRRRRGRMVMVGRVSRHHVHVVHIAQAMAKDGGGIHRPG